MVDPAGVTAVACGWCERPTHDWTRVVLCACGAMGLLASPHDFDETAGELFVTSSWVLWWR